MAVPQLQGDEAAHRHPDDGDPVQAQHVEHHRHVVGVAGEPVGALDLDAVAPAPQVGRDERELGRLGVQPGPEPAMAADPVDREHRRGGTAEDLVREVATGHGHRPDLGRRRHESTVGAAPYCSSAGRSDRRMRMQNSLPSGSARTAQPRSGLRRSLTMVAPRREQPVDLLVASPVRGPQAHVHAVLDRLGLRHLEEEQVAAVRPFESALLVPGVLVLVGHPEVLEDLLPPERLGVGVAGVDAEVAGLGSHAPNRAIQRRQPPPGFRPVSPSDTHTVRSVNLGSALDTPHTVRSWTRCGTRTRPAPASARPSSPAATRSSRPST